MVAHARYFLPLARPVGMAVAVVLSIGAPQRVAGQNFQVQPHGLSVQQSPNTSNLTASFSVLGATIGQGYFLQMICAGQVTSCSSPLGQNVTASSTSFSVPVNYATTGTGTGRVGVWVYNCQGCSQSDSGWDNVTVITYGVSVTPKGGTTATRTANTGGYSESFTVQNTGSASNTYSFSCSGASGVTCGTVPAAVTLAASGQTTVSMPYSVGAPGTGTLSLTASGTNASDAGSYSVPIVSYGVAVTPKGGTTATRTANTGGYSESFTVQNTGSASNTYSFSCSGAGGVTCGTVPGAVTLAASGQTTVSLPYSVGAPGTGTLALTASGTNASDQGSYSVPIVSYGVVVTPKGATTATRTANTGGYSESFTVQNTGSASNTYSFTCSGAGGVQCGAVPAAVTLATNGQTTVSMPYSVQGGGTGTLSLTASGTNASDAGSYNVPVVGYGVSVMPKGATTANRLANTSGYADTFRVTNMGSAANTYSVTCSGSANVTCTGVSAASVTLNPGASAIDTARYNVGAVGNGTLTLSASGSNASDAGSYSVPVVSTVPQAPVVDVTNVNNSGLSDRSVCLTVAAGSAAASNCGDLRLVHALPTTRTLNKVRTPTLLYTSQFAHPYVLVAANVTLPQTGTTPDSVTGTVTVNGIAYPRGKWIGTTWAQGQTRRVVVGYDGLSVVTGMYAYTLEVRNWYPSTSLSTTVTGQLAVVNLSNSAFGAGWWFAGLEQLNVGTMVWVGGDGSVRPYQTAGTNVWVAPAVDRPDTLKWNPTLSRYIRYLPHGLQVQFDATGKHVATVNRLQQTTTFAYDGCGRLSTITLPPASAGLTYQFAYASPTDCTTRLTSVTAPPVGATSRVAALTVTNGQVTAIGAPDNTSVGFGYDPGFTNRITSRTGRRGYTTSYAFDAGNKLVKDSLPLGGGQTPIVARFRPLESLGLTAAVDTVAAYTRLVGARTDVADTTAFWLDRYGAPRRIVNALGAQTLLTRGDSRWPGLVTRAAYANGRVMGVAYDDHGNLTAITDSSNSKTVFHGDVGYTIYATTRYVWNRTWDFDSIVSPPEGDSIVIAYDPGNGNRLWQQDARGTVSRDSFFYYQSGTAVNLLRSIRTPSQGPTSPRDSVIYDATLGNVSGTKTPLGFWTTYVGDAIGRDTLDLSPIDSAQTLFQRKRTQYDSRDRDTLVVSIGPQMPGSVGHPPDTLFLRKIYDVEGNVITVTRRASPDRNGTGTITTSSRYDAAGRQVAAVAADGLVDSTTYDPAGNPIARLTRRGQLVTTTYDALNRVIRRVVPSMSFGSVSSPEFFPGTGTRSFPRYPNNGSSLSIYADTAIFGYDSVGNVVRADNGDAWVHRAYNRNGSVLTDSLYIRTYSSNDFTTHRYGLQYAYDLDTRRTYVGYPTQLLPQVPGTGTGNGYTYTPFGKLATASDVLQNSYRVAYDVEGRVDTLYSPGGIWGHPTYDLDSRATLGQIMASNFIASDTGFPSSAVRGDTIRFDARNKVVSARMAARQRDIQYSGLGMVSHDTTTDQRGYGWWYTVGTSVWDALGNLTTSSQADSWCSLRNDSFRYQAGTERQKSKAEGICVGNAPDSSAGGDWDSTDASGNLARQRRWVGQLGCIPGNPPLCQYYQDPFEETFFYYGADERLRVVDRQRTKYDNDSLYATFFEEYRYDALGRRILKRSRANSACTTSIYCKSAIERYVWDGDQILFEIRYPGWDTVSTSNLERDTTTLGADGRFYGRVAYTHAGGIDRPLGVIRIGYGDDFADGLGYAQFAPMAVTPHVSWEQIIDAASYETGAARRCLPPANSSGHFYRCVQNLWQVRSAQQRPDGNVQKRPLMWFGSLMQDKMDETGQLFMRNRYYDPVTGRFTQEDPLGLAGGVNLYGFARGDLVNYGDPFGLFPCCDIGMAFAWSAIQEEIESEEYAAYQKSLAASGPVTAVGVDVGVVSPVGGWVAGFGAYSSDAGGGYYVTVPDKDKAAPLGGSDPPSAGVDVITSDNLAAFSGPSEGGGGSYFYMNYTRFTNDNGKTQSFGLGVSTAAPWLPTGYFGDTRTYITPPGALDPPKLPFGLDWAFTP